jgi:cytochrome c-type biogenesis protein
MTFSGETLGLAAVSLAAATVSIATPCCLPLIPGYLAYVSGVSAGEMGHTKRVLGAASLFVLGFAIVFTALGATASVLGTFLVGRLSLLVKVGGVFVIAMGLATVGVLRVPFLHREKRLDLNRVRLGPAGAVPLGMAFAFGWTPCIGPVLGAILTTAATTQSASRGAFLLFMYSLAWASPSCSSRSCTPVRAEPSESCATMDRRSSGLEGRCSWRSACCWLPESGRASSPP